MSQCLPGVVRWLRDAYPFWPVKITPISTSPVPAPGKRSRSWGQFNRAFTGRASLQHSWLKWFALNHFALQAEYEVEVWLPNVLGVSGSRYSGTRGQILVDIGRRGPVRSTRVPGHYWLDGTIVRADVANYDCIAEIGVTSPRALVEPLWSYAAKEVLWFPFQCEEREEHWTDFDRMCGGYRIQRDSHARKNVSVADRDLADAPVPVEPPGSAGEF